jgi:dolichol-phosphate mannosyltransferase
MISVVLPAYEEEENLRIILPRLKAQMDGTGAPYEILVVDSRQAMDGTREVCLQNSVKCLERENADTYGDAVRTGIARAAGEHILFMDADGSHPPEFIPRLCEFKEECDVVIASRYVTGGSTENNMALTLMSLTVNVLYSLVLGLNCRDVSTSFKLYRAQPLKRLSLSCDNFDIIEEMLFKLKKSDCRIKEIPFAFKQRMFGKTKRNLFLFALSFLFTLLKLRCGNRWQNMLPWKREPIVGMKAPALTRLDPARDNKHPREP